MSAQPTEETEVEEYENPWLEYERRKDLLPVGLSPFEHDQARQKIADELGL